MGVFKSLRGKVESGADVGSDPQSVGTDNNFAESHDSSATKQEKKRFFGHSSEQSSSLDQSVQSSNPFHQQTPRHGQAHPSESYQPPNGPPPSLRATDNESYAPPPGPPPTHADASLTNPPPYHDWTVIPDTALLPPPPAAPNEYSPTNNASYDSAAAAHEWCARYPPYTPSVPSHAIYTSVQAGELTLEQPANFKGELLRLAPGAWRIDTATRTGLRGRRENTSNDDFIFLSKLPLFFATIRPDGPDHPLSSERPKVIYYEVKAKLIKDDNSGIAIGFAAKPYPSWRLPGWHRASIGVHGDDGRRYVNDPWGGLDFVDAFRNGDTVGLGMRFSPQQLTLSDSSQFPQGQTQKVKTQAFFTRNGREEDHWDMDEERDAERDEGVEGLMGELDMYPAIGVFGRVEVEVHFKDTDWMFRPG